VYAARETDTLGIRSEDLAAEIRKRGTESYYLPDFKSIENFIVKNSLHKDLLITMGAGDIYRVGENLLTGR
ncbi:MAG: UDP-N-acetylmuramate--L-alanine ligase, partial [Clostridiales bacterium]|nr:UDP-N-acetylmuramate--L-alanine ligase [Clostridiales bacterium]